MYYCYILYSENLDKFYIGSTGDLEGRLQRHNISNHGYTSTGKPCKIKYFETFETKTEALKREAQLKNWKNRKALEELIGEKLAQWFRASRFSSGGSGVPPMAIGASLLTKHEGQQKLSFFYYLNWKTDLY